MPNHDRDELPIFGDNYDLERWSTGEHDAEGHLVWHHTLPNNDDWERITDVTLNFDPTGEGDFRNYKIDPDRPLDPYGLDLDNPDHYDLDDLAYQAFIDYGFEV